LEKARGGDLWRSLLDYTIFSSAEIGQLAERAMNGRDIEKAVTNAQQLVLWRKLPLSFDLLIEVLDSSQMPEDVLVSKV
jgi:hypothetical protein